MFVGQMDIRYILYDMHIVLFWYVVFWLYHLQCSSWIFTHILQDCFTGTRNSMIAPVSVKLLSWSIWVKMPKKVISCDILSSDSGNIFRILNSYRMFEKTKNKNKNKQTKIPNNIYSNFAVSTVLAGESRSAGTMTKVIWRVNGVNLTKVIPSFDQKRVINNTIWNAHSISYLMSTTLSESPSHCPETWLEINYDIDRAWWGRVGHVTMIGWGLNTGMR